MIRAFGSQGSEDVWVGDDTKAARKACPVELWGRARRLLDQLNAATVVADMRLPPSNRLHKMKGDLAGLHSVSINMKYRIVFKLESGNATAVEILEYH